MRDKFSALLVEWCDESEVKCRPMYAPLVRFDLDKTPLTFGTGDKARFIKRVRAIANKVEPGYRVTVKWDTSPVVNHCIDVAFGAEKDA